MPINVVHLPAEPQCGGNQWVVRDFDQLANLAALVLLGRAQHAVRILEGAQRNVAMVPARLKARLQRDLFPADDADPWHRDGLLFEIICWIVARIGAGPNDVISDPHLKSTQQGTDALKVTFDPALRSLIRSTIYEYKCTSRARRLFKKQVLIAFLEYFEGARDDQLSQITISLLGRFGLTDAEQLVAYQALVFDRPLAFQAAMTVTPEEFPANKCVKLFKNFSDLPVSLEARFGDTFPLPDIRKWFDLFAAAVWAKIEAGNV
jgi:hypothetical protein